MNTRASPNIDFAKTYAKWLHDHLVNVRHNDIELVSTPFLDPFNDGIEVAIDNTNGETIFHDLGRTINNLLDHGVDITKSEKKMQIVAHAIAGCGVRFNENLNRLEISANSSNYAQKMHFLTTSIMRLNDLWMTAKPRTTTDFFETVKDFLDMHDILYTANKYIPGQAVEHPIDFIIPLKKGKERLIKLIPNPSIQTAKLTSFAWIDLKNAHYQAEKFVLINDIKNEYQSKKSENIDSILETYSDKVMHWHSAENDPNFAVQLSHAR